MLQCQKLNFHNAWPRRYRVYQHLHVFFNEFRIIGLKYKRHATIILPLFRRGKFVNNLNLIIDCTDKLLDQWHLKTDSDPNHAHQRQNLPLAIFGFIGFDYGLQILEESNIDKTNKITQALDDFFEIFVQTTRLPKFLTEFY